MKKDWKKILTPEQYKVMREKGTEAPFSGKLLHNKQKGQYLCAACGTPLFDSESKFDSGTGWPSFRKSIEKNVILRKDGNRTEVVCKKCGSHLGHVFEEEQRFCINSVCLNFKNK